MKGVIFLVCICVGKHPHPEKLHVQIENIIEYLIEECGVTDFYVGAGNDFEIEILHILRVLSRKRKQIRYTVISVTKKQHFWSDEHVIYLKNASNSLVVRNRWMLSMADCLLCNVEPNDGINEIILARAQNSSLTVINIFDEKTVPYVPYRRAVKI